MSLMLSAPATMPATSQLATFWLDGDLYGVEVEHVQEVLRSQSITRVPLAPTAVAGLAELRPSNLGFVTHASAAFSGLLPRDTT